MPARNWTVTTINDDIIVLKINQSTWNFCPSCFNEDELETIKGNKELCSGCICLPHMEFKNKKQWCEFSRKIAQLQDKAIKIAKAAPKIPIG